MPDFKLTEHSSQFPRRLPILICIFAALALSACASVATTGTSDVAGKAVSYAISGKNEPTVVFQSGLGDGKDAWAGVFSAVASTHRVFAYDRPGYGSSPAADGPRDPCSIAAEERKLLRSAGIAPPYILVGHSAGGLYQFVYAKLYPEDVAGLVLLDPTHPQHWQIMQSEAPAAASIMRVFRNTVFSSTERREFDDMASCLDRLDMRQAPHMPARVLVRTRFDGAEAGDFETMTLRQEQDWKALAGVDHIEPIAGSGHYIQKDNPQVVIKAIDTLEAVTRNASTNDPVNRKLLENSTVD